MQPKLRPDYPKRKFSCYFEQIKKLPEHPRAGEYFAKIDKLALFMTGKEYNGNNPALARIHAPCRAALQVIAAIIIISGIFGAIIPMESAAIADGNVAVISKKKTVQHLEGGIIKNILVKEGQQVKQGEPLIEISDVAPKANKGIVQSDLWTAKATEERINALQNKTDLEFSEELREAAKNSEELRKTLKSQEELFTANRDAQEGKLNSFNQRIKGIEEEISGLKAQKESSQSQLALTIEELASIEELYKQKMASKPRLIELQRRVEELKGNIGQYTAQIAKAEQSITETGMDIINLENEFSTKLAEELDEARSKIADYHEKLRAATDVVERTIITSPSEGIVNGLKFHTVGGVISAGEPIMDIIPQSDKLVLEVKIRPTDIDAVEIGMPVRISFAAFQSRKMPLLSGKVTQISADAFSEQNAMQNISYYKGKVEVDGDEIARLDSKIKLSPGMPATAFIRTGSRTFFSYMLAPLTDSFERAFKED